VLAGSAAPVDPVAWTVNTLNVAIGVVDAPVAFAGLTLGFSGLYKVNVTVPAGITTGNAVPVVLSLGGQQGPPVTIAVQ